MVEVLVEYDYQAEQEDELTIKKGDIIKNVVMSDGGWWEGELSGRKGMFPDNFVKVIDKNNKEKKNKDDTPVQASKRTSVKLLADKIKDIVQDGPGQTSGKKKDPVHQKKRAKVLFSYEPENEDELKLELGDTVDVIKQVEDGWYEGSVNGKTGVFPSNFVEVLLEENDQEKEEEDKSLIKGKKIIGVGLGNIFGSGPIKLRSTGASTKPVSDDKTAESKDTKPPNEEAVLRRPKTDATPGTAYCGFNHPPTNPSLNVVENIGEDLCDSFDSSAEEYERQIADLKIRSHDNMNRAKTEGKLVSEAFSKLTAGLNRKLLHDVDSIKEEDLIEYIDEVPDSEEFDTSVESLTSYYTPRLTNVLNTYYRGAEGITANNSANMHKVGEDNEQSFYTPNSSSNSITYRQIPESVKEVLDDLDHCLAQSCPYPEPQNRFQNILHGEGHAKRKANDLSTYDGLTDEKKSKSEPDGFLYRTSSLLEKLSRLNIFGQKSHKILKPKKESQNDHNPTFSTPKDARQQPGVCQVVDSIAVTKKRWSEAHRRSLEKSSTITPYKQSFDTQEITENVAHHPSKDTSSESPQDEVHHFINPQNVESRYRTSNEEQIGLQKSDTYFSTLNEKGYLSPFIKNIAKKYKLTDLYTNCIDQTCSLKNVKDDFTDIDQICSPECNTEEDEPYSSSFFQDDDEDELNVFEETTTSMNSGKIEDNAQKIDYNKFEHDVAELMSDIMRRSQERVSKLDNQYPIDVQVCSHSTEDMSLSCSSEDSINTTITGAKMNCFVDSVKRDDDIGPWVSPAALGKASSRALEMDRITSSCYAVPFINGEWNRCLRYSISDNDLKCSKTRKQSSFCRIPFGSSENCNWFSKDCEESPSESLAKIGRVPNVRLSENKVDLANEALKRDSHFRSQDRIVTDYKEDPSSLPTDVSIKHSQYFFSNTIPCHADMNPVGIVEEETEATANVASYSAKVKSSFCRIPFLPLKDDSCWYSRGLFESPTKEDASLKCKLQKCESREDRITHSSFCFIPQEYDHSKWYSKDLKQSSSENLEGVCHTQNVRSDDLCEQQSSACSASSSKFDSEIISTSASEIIWPFHANDSTDEEAHNVTSSAANTNLELTPDENKQKTQYIDWASFLFGNNKNFIHPGDGDNKSATSSAKQKRSESNYENSDEKIHFKSLGMKSSNCTWAADIGSATTANSSRSSKSEGSICKEKKLGMDLRDEVAGLCLEKRKKHSFWRKLFSKQYREPVGLLSYHSDCKNVTVETSFQKDLEMKTQTGQYCNDSKLSDSFSPSQCIVDKFDYIVNLDKSPRFIFVEKKSKIKEHGKRGTFDLTGQASERSLISETRLLYEIPDDLENSTQVVPETEENSSDSIVHRLYHDDSSYQEASEPITSLEETRLNRSFFDTEVDSDIRDIIVKNEHNNRCQSLYEYFSELNKYDWVSEEHNNGPHAVHTRDPLAQESFITVCEKDKSQNAIGDIPVEMREQTVEQQDTLQETVDQNMAQDPSSEMLADEDYFSSISTIEDNVEVDNEYPSPDPDTLLQDLRGINFTETPDYAISDVEESREMRMFLQQALQPIDNCFSECYSFSSSNSTPSKPPEKQLCMGVDKIEANQEGAESLETHNLFSIKGSRSSMQYSDHMHDMQSDLSELDTMEIPTGDEGVNLYACKRWESPSYRYIGTVESELDRLEINTSGNMSFDSRDLNNSADVSKMTYPDIPGINESLESAEACADAACSGDTSADTSYFPSNNFTGNFSQSNSAKSGQYVKERMSNFQEILKRFSVDDSLTLSPGITYESSFQSRGSPGPASSTKESFSISISRFSPNTDCHSQDVQLESPVQTCIEDQSFNFNSTTEEQPDLSNQNSSYDGNNEMYKLYQSLNKSYTEVSDEFLNSSLPGDEDSEIERALDCSSRSFSQ